MQILYRVLEGKVVSTSYVQDWIDFLQKKYCFVKDKNAFKILTLYENVSSITW
jgi:hypothetical protein